MQISVKVQVKMIGEDLDLRDNEVRSRSRPDPSIQGRGCGSTTADDQGVSGRYVDNDLTNAFAPHSLDLIDERVSQNVCSLNNTLIIDSEILEYISLFMDDEFWRNLSEKTNRRAKQTKRNKPIFTMLRISQTPLYKD